jgi:hypothetical protein
MALDREVERLLGVDLVEEVGAGPRRQRGLEADDRRAHGDRHGSDRHGLGRRHRLLHAIIVADARQRDDGRSFDGRPPLEGHQRGRRGLLGGNVAQPLDRLLDAPPVLGGDQGPSQGELGIAGRQ